MSESRGSIVEELRAEFLEKVAQIRRELSHINYLEEKAGLPLTRLDDFGQLPAAETGATTPSGGTAAHEERRAGPKPQISHDEYLGLDPLKAAKEYMRRVRRAVEIGEVAEAISKGGAATSGTDWRDRLELGLTRSVRDVVKVRDGIFGLKDLYSEDQLRGLRASRNPPKKAKTRKKKGKKKKPQADSAEAS